MDGKEMDLINENFREINEKLDKILGILRPKVKVG